MSFRTFVSHTSKLLLISSVSIVLTACSGDDQALVALDKFTRSQPIDKNNQQWREQLAKPPQVEFTANAHYLWQLETNKGQITIELMHDTAPMHASSTIYLTRMGFYDGIIFHRVIPGFMAQGGDPKGVGSGGPGYQYAGEFSGGSHDKAGILSMANSGPNTDGSQFFITFKPTPFLDGRHTVFGEVIAGMETLESLETFGSRSGLTSEVLRIVKATITVE